MEAQEEVVMGSKDQTNIVKGKRTKRFRPLSPVPFAAVAPNGSMFNGDVNMENKDSYCDYVSLSSSGDEYQESTTEEEEDMANCLILLAQGQSREPPKLLQHQHQQQDSGSFTINSIVGALGGHRASHKKPKAAAVVEEKIRQFTAMTKTMTTETIRLPDEEEGQQFMKTNYIPSLSLQLSNANNNHNNNNRGLYGNNNSNNNMKPNKVHECSICGSEFTSGQALGGHMRRHRGSIGTNITAANTALSLKVPNPMEQPQQPKNVLSLDLDLNLPAPDDDHREPKLPFASKQHQPQQQQSALVFSAPTLVDCHY
ncbi:Cupredoxin superfamily protein [Hibiscus syriacus]|uniref:Cupredoxin superfamily protein n=1 Tax=Hibiscus syriacus TaxID=106335 RepID=A0A6A3BNP4_HIBSY|nr:Cupredoxin superfamily protein [Hibiscus syriacus]